MRKIEAGNCGNDTHPARERGAKSRSSGFCVKRELRNFRILDNS
jgi:hypothetical protein